MKSRLARILLLLLLPIAVSMPAAILLSGYVRAFAGTDRMPILAASGVFGLFIGLICVMGLIQLRPTFDRPAGVSRFLGVPLLGVTPDVASIAERREDRRRMLVAAIVVTTTVIAAALAWPWLQGTR